MKSQIKELMSEAIKKTFPDIEMPDFGVEYADKKFGDFSTNAAMILAKAIGEEPGEITEKIIKRIKRNEIIEKVEFAKPGFINFKIALPYWQKQIPGIINAGKNYGKSDLGKDLKVNIEFISANPTGPLTIGNARGGVIGDTMANIFAKTGWQVTREYYFNDAGGQIDILGHSILKDNEAQYRGDYIDELRQKIKTDDYKEAGRQAAQEIIGGIKETTENVGIKFDVWFAEGKDLREKGKIDEAIKWLRAKDLAYDKEGAVWFRSTKFGDDKDRVLIKSTGEPTYFASDAAYHRNKFEERKFDFAIDVWGADHYGDIARIKGFVKALGHENTFEVILHQFVRIIVEGKEVRMSKRTGQFVAVDDLLKEVGKDVYRFFMLNYDLNSHINFDLKLAKERSEKNPVFYIQYAHARINSILAKLKTQSSNVKTTTKNLELLDSPAEIGLIKQLIKLPELVLEIVDDYQVQKLPAYSIELARAFHNFYEECPILQAEENLKNARLKLVRATQIVLKNTLDLMGVSAPERM